MTTRELRDEASKLVNDAMKRLPTIEVPDNRIAAKEGDTNTLLNMEVFEQLLKINGCRDVPFDFSEPGAYGRAVMTWRTLLVVRVAKMREIKYLDGSVLTF